MKNFLDYCFYRAAAFYKNWGDKDIYCFSGSIVSYGSLIFLIMTIFLIVYTQLFGGVPTKTIFIIGGILNVIICIFSGNEKKFVLLEKKYKHEKHKKLKGWIVIAYWLLSWATFISVCLIL